MKSLPQVWKEYLKSKNATNLYQMEIEDMRGQRTSHSDVTGLHETKDEHGIWLEFDCSSMHTEQRQHYKLHGHVTKTVTLNKDDHAQGE